MGQIITDIRQLMVISGACETNIKFAVSGPQKKVGKTEGKTWDGTDANITKKEKMVHMG